ncbi:zinc metalloproteinase nas-15-like isoform X2 [Montipora foliosa]|uniref:zinc metalloproteinase nas-15-like isoform X2 n=1 Tax=Montipora foliosa TaxID=591990 RepID=UPI0035F1C3EC
MTPICAFIAILCIPHCSGRYFTDRIFRPKPRMPLQDIAQSDAGCVDDKNYADGCHQQAAIANYCMHHETFMRKHCPLSCKFCSQETAKPPAPAGTKKAPAPIVCEDDPAYADGCPAFAAVENYCQDQETFARTFCRKSCKFCTGDAK